MTTFTITASNSVRTTGAGENAFENDTSGTDTLIVQDNAYLKAEGAYARGAYLGPNKPWKVTVAGEISSAQSEGLVLDGRNSGTSAITISEGGLIDGAYTGVWLNSAATLVNDGDIFSGNIAIALGGAGTHTIKNTGLIRAPGGTFAVTDLDGLSADIIENQGGIYGHVSLNGGNDSLSNAFVIDGVVSLGAGNDTLVNSGTIKNNVYAGEGNDVIRNTKELNGLVVTEGGNDSVENSGFIGKSVILGEGDDTMTNSGTVAELVDLGNGKNTLTNSGRIDGIILGGTGIDTVTNSGDIFSEVRLLGGDDRLSNSGFIDERIDFGEGNNTLINSDTIQSDVEFGQGDDTVTNSGLLYSNVVFGGGSNSLSNKGQIGGSVEGGDGNDTIRNSGSIAYDVLLGSGKNTLTNTGTIGHDIHGESGVDIVTNSKTIGGGLFLGDGADVVTNKGTIAGEINLGAGSDRFNGSNGTEQVWDGAGADTIKLAGGNDFYYAGNNGGDGLDTIDGGTGLDSYVANSLDDTYINLDSVARDMSPFAPGAGYVAASTAYGVDISGGFKDSIKGFENVYGGAGYDLVYGSAVGNYLDGGAGFDTLFGFGGDDTLLGGAGTDTLCGGAGRDFLTGGAGGDFFLFVSVAESGITETTRDTIFDFEDNLDRIDVSTIDANIRNGTVNDAFTFIGTNQAFSGRAGELRAVWTTGEQLVEGDLNGDGKADFSIELVDPNHLVTLTANDFVL